MDKNKLFDFPVDFVYTWVDSQDIKWQSKKASVLGENIVEDASKENCRFVNSNELLYSIRSIYKNCPWFNKIYIVTDEQVPDWLDCTDGKVIIIDHKTIFENNEVLPTFNSNVIESRLHHIPNLSEHYVSLNDDFFIGRPLKKQFFFTGDGISKIFLSTPKLKDKILKLISEESLNNQPQYLSTLHRTRKLVFEKTENLILNEPKHTPRPFCKSDLFEVEKIFTDIINDALQYQFRNRNGIYFLALVMFYLVSKGRKVHTIKYTFFRNSKKYLSRFDYIKVSPRDSNKILQEYRLIKFIKPAFFCINDNSATTNENRVDMVAFLSKYFNEKSPIES